MKKALTGMTGRGIPISPPPRLILFDLDDTLCDYATARQIRLRQAFSIEAEEWRADRSEQRLEEMIAESIAISPHGADHFPQLFEKYGFSSPAAAEAAAAWYRSNRFFRLELFPDAIATLRSIRRPELAFTSVEPRRIGIVTNGPADVQREKVRLLGVDKLVDFVVISGEVGIAKPDPRIFEKALQLGAAAAEEAVFIGDTPEFDISGAMASGIRSIWMNRAGTAWPGPGKAPAFAVRDLASLLPLLGATMVDDRD